MTNDYVTTASQKNHRTICLPFCDKEYGKIIDDAGQFRHFLDCSYEKMSDLFPPNFLQGYQLKDSRMSNVSLRIMYGTMQSSFIFQYIICCISFPLTLYFYNYTVLFKFT
jgi:hypothetical protein